MKGKGKGSGKTEKKAKEAKAPAAPAKDWPQEKTAKGPRLECDACHKKTDHVKFTPTDGRQLCDDCYLKAGVKALDERLAKKRGGKPPASDPGNGLPELKKLEGGKYIIRPLYLNQDEWNRIVAEKQKTGRKYADIYRLALRAYLKIQ